MIKRELTPHLHYLSTQFPVVAVMGPRQSGKTTLVRQTFAHYTYVTMEDLDRRSAAQEDPRGFFATYATGQGLIIDEIQETPDLLSYMQGIVDQDYKPGFFIITGSQHFLLYEKISQTLAGRIAVLTLLPLSTQEIKAAEMLPASLESLLIRGCYPRLYAQTIDTHTWYTNYISTYIEKDVRQVLQISNVVTFQRFLKLCAARVGNVLNYADLARDADISPNTAKAWISILEMSFIIKLLYPYYKNFNKRVIKSPKLYFYDSALVCNLLGIRTEENLLISTFRGAIFESFIITELMKYNYNHNRQPAVYFWRDVQGHEIDCIVEQGVNQTVPIEIKAGRTVNRDFFKELIDWYTITQEPKKESYIVYAGDETLQREHGKIIPWHTLTTMLQKIYPV